MTYEVVFRTTAERELLDAQRWYEDERKGLGGEFALAIDRLIDLIIENPRLFPEIYRDVRRAASRPFPYLLWCRIVNDQVVVLACVHGKRDQRRIVSRFDEEASYHR